MNFHEYQAKELFVQFGIPVPQGTIASTPDAAVEVARQIGGDQWVVKAQIHAGGRGKAGGVKVVKTLTQVRDSAAKMLGTRMETYQSGGRALPVNVVLITEATEISKELYLSMLVDRASRAVTFIASPMGGVDIEQVANDHPEKIFTVEVNFMQSLQAFECRKLGFSMGLGAKQTAQLAKIMMAMFNLFNQCDMSLIELNPLVINSAGDLVALDGKLNCDDNALFRQARLEAMRDVSQDDPLEAQAAKHDLNYVSLDGNIACMVNGAGLAMATMDVIKLYGGEPANFLDVGGTADAARVEKAFRIILKDDRVKAILVNIFGGIVRCDRVAQGVVDAYKNIGDIPVPIIVRLQGTNAEEAKQLIDNSGLKVLSAVALQEAADRVKEVLA